ncbi:MAG: response regulator transcription factor [Bacteroidota bacterium]
MKIDTVRIILFDNQPLFIKGMADFLSREAAVQSVTTCTSYDGFLQHLKQEHFDLAFIELNFGHPHHDGFTLSRELKQLYPQLFIAILSHYNAPHFVHFANECGAAAFFDKHTGPDLIDDFLYRFANGTLPNYYVMVSPYNNHAQHPLVSDDFELRYLLTRQECRVMKLIVGGKEHTEIEEELHISYDTFKTHHRNILSALHVKNDIELTKFAMLYHLTDTDCNQLPALRQRGSVFTRQPS